jgi:L-histidine N-alpha-methyltransferase
MPARTVTNHRPLAFTDHLPHDFEAVGLRADVAHGLTATPKALPPKWFYDKLGSELFEEITRLPEYYPTRIERGILHEHARTLVETAGAGTIIELGSGSSEKTRLLLDALVARSGRLSYPPGYVALDVSENALRGACSALADSYPTLRIEALRADFTHQLDLLPTRDRRLVAFLGSTIGNFEPIDRAAFLAQVRSCLRPGDHFLLGADLVKPVDILLPAYDDAAGVTSAFNLNVLDVLNRRLGADFARADFEHHALWDIENEWIEMRLRARRSLTVTVPDLDLEVRFAAGEEVRTEISAKFRRHRLESELVAAGFSSAGWWTDPAEWFSVSLWTAE